MQVDGTVGQKLSLPALLSTRWCAPVPAELVSMHLLDAIRRFPTHPGCNHLEDSAARESV